MTHTSKRFNPWTILAVTAWLAGASVPFVHASVSLDAGTTSTQLIALLVTYLVIAMLINGLGLLMRASAHGATSSRGRRLDGWGKIVGLAGWALGLTSAVMFALDGPEAHEWVLIASITVFLVAPVIAIAVMLLRTVK